MNISILIKSGTGGYFDECGCDMCLMDIENPNFPIPRIGETIEILENNDKGRTNTKGEITKEYHDYLIRDIRYWVMNENSYGVKIYVVPIGRCVPD